MITIITINEIKGKRLLYRFTTDIYDKTIGEATNVEISPSKKYVKIGESWYLDEDVIYLEILE